MHHLTLKQIQRFLKKINYHQSIKIHYLKESKKNKKKINWLCAQAAFSRYLEKNSKNIMIASQIEISKQWKKRLSNNQFKAVLLHEIGHLYTGFIIKKNQIIEKSKSLCEFEAQNWALKRSQQLHFKNIRREILTLYYEWSQFNWKSPERIYLKAYKMAVKKGILKKILQ